MEVESPLKICISVFPWKREVTNGIVAASVIPAKAAEVRVWRVSDQTGLSNECRSILSYAVRLDHNCSGFFSPETTAVLEECSPMVVIDHTAE